ncbi:NADH:flavin oxidoreductase [Hyphococcus formosus]
MTSNTKVLFEPAQLGSLALSNRIAMAPMTRSFSPNGVPGDDVVGYYQRRAAGGVGLILSEGVHTNETTAAGTPNVPNIVTDEAKAGWRKVIDAVHAEGGKMGLQIWHEGPFRNPKNTNHPDIPSWSASGMKIPGKPLWDPMTEEEIETAINEYVDAAVATKELGFDCAEFHGAHGYLIDNFFWDATNQRTDKWGGDWNGRTRFATEIIRRTREKVGPDFPLIIRLSQWKQQDFTAQATKSPEEMLEWLQPMVDAGIDIFHCSQRRFWEPEFEGSDLNFAGWAKKLTGKPTISVGSVGLQGDFIGAFAGESSKTASLDKLITRMEAEEFDVIAVGRALLQDPDWVAKVRDGRNEELEPFTKDALTSLS